MFDIDYIIPCYGSSDVIRPGLRALANQWHSEYIHVILVDDCSPNTDCGYQDLVHEFKPYLDIICIKTSKNVGQGLARQFGIDNSTHEYFMFQDEDDMLANPLAVSLFIGAVENNTYKKSIDNENLYILNENGELEIDQEKKAISIVSGPLFEFDDNHTRIIEAANRIWVNSKLYNRKFIQKHKIRFNEEQSRHAEDYYFMSCFFYALDNDPTYTGILLDDNQLTYMWWPNENSQSRCDEHYGFMLSGYTMAGSLNILEYMKCSKSIEFGQEQQVQIRRKVLNMTMYAYFTLLSFIRHVASTDWVPERKDWYTLQSACINLNKILIEYYDTYTYTEKIEEYYIVKNMTDVQFTEPWVDFDTYVEGGCREMLWSYDNLLACKNSYHFNEAGMLI